MKGYWENRGGDRPRRCGPARYPWEKVLYTGDLFRTDEEGFLYFVGRKDDIIKTRGEKVSPKEVENVLYALPGVARGGGGRRARSDPRHGDQGGRRARAGRGADRGDVIRHCARILEDFMVPKVVEFRDRAAEDRERKDQPGVEVEAKSLEAAQ